MTEQEPRSATKKRKPAGMLACLRAWAPIAWRSALPFAALGLYLVLHKTGVVPRREAITYETTLILNLVLYWLVLSILLASVAHRRPVTGWLRAQAPQLVLLAFSGLLSLGFGEIAIRLLRPDLAARPFERLPSETMHHRNAPNRSSLGMGNQRVVTNSDGFRSSYEREDFLELEHRVVVLGDSYAFGLGVAGDSAVGSLLEDKLRRRLGSAGDSSLGVLNTGVISYSPYLERQVFRQVAGRYRPTLTLLLLDINDIGDDHQYASENLSGDDENPRFAVPAVDDTATACDFSALCRALGPLWQRLDKPLWVARRILGREKERYDYYDFKVEIGGREERNRFFVLRYPLADSRPFLDATWRNLEAVARDVESSGSDFVAVVMPRYFHWNDAECPDNWESDRYGVDEPFENVFLEYFDQRARSASFPVWSLLPPFLEAGPDEPLVFRHDPHWNEKGHQVAAEAIADWLVASGWPNSLAAGSRLSFPTGPSGGLTDG